MTFTTTSRGQPAAEIGRLLNQLLADESVLYITTRDYLLSVTRSGFAVLRAHFEALYNQVSQWVDDIAERARAIGVSTRESWANLALSARVSAAPADGLSVPRMVSELLRLQLSLIARVWDALHACGPDAGTATLLDGLLRKHEQEARALRAHARAAAAAAPMAGAILTLAG